MPLSERLKQHALLIESSDSFDPSWYLRAYPDVAELGIAPALHYLRWGARMGRNPSPDFDTAHYLTSYPDVVRSGMNPFIHYLKYGITEGRSPRPGVRNSQQSQPQAKTATTTTNVRRVDSTSIRCTIVVPVYDAHDEVLDCIHSVLRHTEIGSGNRLLVLDDASPDPRIRDMLAAFSGLQGVEIVHNTANLGYTANVNLGCRLAEEDDVVLLNSDTVVGPHWLRNLKQAAYQHSRVGTVTAISDNAGAFSVPQPGTNKRPDGLAIDAAARVAADTAIQTVFEVPTGNGFCFYIRRALLREIGAFNVEAFPRGYGEENDFCMRALDAGWTNLVAAGVYVAHVRSASFKDQKEALVQAGVEAVKQRHPAYAGAVKAIGSSLRFQRVRGEIGSAFAHAARSGDGSRPRILFVLSTRTGGTPQTNRDLMNAIADVYDCYALRCDRRKIEVLEATDTDYRVIKAWQLGDLVTFATHASHEYNDIVRSILVDLSIDLLHIRHIAWHSLHLPEIARGVGVPVINSFHDFYAVCPTVNLIDQAGRYWPCGVEREGRNPLWANDPTALPVTPEMLGEWQRKMQVAFRRCDAFVTTCETARDVICNALPMLSERSEDFHIIRHGRDFEEFGQLAADEAIGSGEALRILLPGNIGLSKGKELVKQVKQADVDGLLEFHVLGNSDEDLKPWVIDHGRYSRDEFAARVGEIRPHIAAVLSIWPETYCHTLTESWACGLPVLGVAHGAVAERITRHGGGWLVNGEPAAILDRLLEIRNDREARLKQAGDVVRWQTGYGKQNTAARMSEQYLALYRAVIGRRRLPQHAARKRVAFVMKGCYPFVPATAYVRLVDWKNWFEERYGGPVDYLDWSALLRAELGAYSTIVVQRNAIPAERVDAVLEAINEAGSHLVLELDDDLFDVPADVDEDTAYANYRSALEKICRNAVEVHVTNTALKQVCERYNDNVVIRPNRLPAHRWRIPEEAQGIAPAMEPESINVLYFGSRTHARDLAFAIEAVRLGRSHGANIHLHVVGIPLPDGCKEGFVHAHTPPCSRYDLFVEWLIGFAINFDAGIAPLVDTRFASTKSYLKALEYAALGLPVLCSKGPPYSELSERKLRGAVTLVRNETADWARVLTSLAKPSPSERQAIRDLMMDFWIYQ